jgi:PIN domain nuclease of toxin-antitoxin system
VILLDASALVAFLAGERGASRVDALLRSGEPAISAVHLAEALDVTVRVRGHDLDAVQGVVVPLVETTLSVVPVGEMEARRGSAVRIAHYDRREAPLSLADGLLIGTASVLGAAIATGDVLLARIARLEGIEVVPL